jgi:glycosyltransferase 2 family protein
MTAFAIGRLHSRRSLTLLLGGIASIAMISFLLRGIDVNDFLSVLAVADVRVLMLVPIAIAGEQLVRAWKWRQVLYPMRPSGTLGLFGAIVLGNLAGLLIPLGTSPIVRAWLVARREGLKTGSVLATVAVDRFIDSIVFIGLIPIALVLAPVRDPTHTLITLSWGAIGLLVFLLLLLLLSYRLEANARIDWVVRLLDHLPLRFADPAQRLVRSFAEGVVWPKETRRGVGIVIASFLIKLITATHWLWAGFAVGIVLHVYTMGAVFALELVGVPKEQALAMVLIVQGINLLTVMGTGILALWSHGIPLSELRGKVSSRERFVWKRS